MKSIFINPQENRLRAGWRIALFLLLFFMGSSLIFVLKPLLQVESKRVLLQNYSLLIIAITAMSATAAVYLSRRWWDKKPFLSLGLKNNGWLWKDLLVGFLFSFGMALLFFLGLYATGHLNMEGLGWEAFHKDLFDEGYARLMSSMSLITLVLLLVEMVIVGFWEELVFRGYVFQNMAEGIGLKLAIVVSCLLYGLVHSTNPNATLLSSMIIVAFGFLRIYGYLATGQLWLSMGMHIGWNFFQGPIFGFYASGHSKATLLQHSTQGADWLTGGSFGPEGSLLILPILLVALFAMYKWAQRDTPQLATQNSQKTIQADTP